MLKKLVPWLLLSLLFILPPASAASRTVLVFGDSLSAGYGIALEDSWPALLAKRLEDNRPRYALSNASISGETTAGGRNRFAQALARSRADIVILALGANDGLRGLPVLQMRQNLIAMIEAAQAQKARVLLVGMKLPPNYGPVYTRRFEDSFRDVAAKTGTTLLPFLLEPLGAGIEDFQADGLHPTAAAQHKLLDHVWPALKPLLK